MFLTSVKPALKFGTMRTLSEVAAKYPMSILKCNSDMEVLISDPNRWVVHGVVVIVAAREWMPTPTQRRPPCFGADLECRLASLTLMTAGSCCWI